MRIEILGSGCARCHALEDNARKAVAGLGRNADIIDVTDMATIMAYGVLSMPALVIDGKVVASGRILSPGEIANLITTAQG